MQEDVLMKIHTGHQGIEHIDCEHAIQYIGVESMQTLTTWSRNVMCVNITRVHNRMIDATHPWEIVGSTGELMNICSL